MHPAHTHLLGHDDDERGVRDGLDLVVAVVLLALGLAALLLVVVIVKVHLGPVAADLEDDGNPAPRPTQAHDTQSAPANASTRHAKCVSPSAACPLLTWGPKKTHSSLPRVRLSWTSMLSGCSTSLNGDLRRYALTMSESKSCSASRSFFRKLVNFFSTVTDPPHARANPSDVARQGLGRARSWVLGRVVRAACIHATRSPFESSPALVLPFPAAPPYFRSYPPPYLQPYLPLPPALPIPRSKSYLQWASASPRTC